MSPIKCKVIKCSLAARECAEVVLHLEAAETDPLTEAQRSTLIKAAEDYAAIVHATIPTPSL